MNTDFQRPPFPVYLFKAYCFLQLAFVVLCFVMAFASEEMQFGDELWIFLLIMIVLFSPFWVLPLVGIFLPRRSWVWAMGFVIMGFGFMFGCWGVVALPMILLWALHEPTKEYYRGRRESIEDVLS